MINCKGVLKLHGTAKELLLFKQSLHQSESRWLQLRIFASGRRRVGRTFALPLTMAFRRPRRPCLPMIAIQHGCCREEVGKASTTVGQ